MKIGITLGIQRDNESMWINGIKLNAIFLMNVLQKTGHEIYLLDTSKKVDREKDGKISNDKVAWDADKFPIHCFYQDDLWLKMDALFLLGTAIGPDFVEKFKSTGKHKRVVKYACGNNYVIDMEHMIFKEGDEVKAGVTFNQNIDEVWYVPQQGYQNHEYYRVTHRLAPEKIMPAPFIWDPMFIDETEGLYGAKIVDEHGNETPKTDDIPIYQPGKNIEDLQISVFEPNLNVVKFSMIPMLIVEDYLDQGGTPPLKLNIISAGRLYKNKLWRETVNKLWLTQKKNKNGAPILQVQHRYPIHYLLSKFTDIVISHQWENPLNYAYLDVMYLQFPLIHNADMIKDAGYYYPDFDIAKGKKQLDWILKNHDDNIDEYNAKNEKVMTRYTAYNEELVETYKKMLDNLFAGKNEHGLSLKYDWKTNLYK